MLLVQKLIEEVIVPPERQRLGLGDEEKKAATEFLSLKASMAANGLLQPIGIDKDNNLLFGFRRLTAAKELKWDTIPAIVDPDRTLTAIERETIELDENIQRMDLSWQEKERAIARLNDLKRKIDPTWTQRKTAVITGVTQSMVSDAEMLSKMMIAFPEIAKAATKNKALSMAKNVAKKTLRRVEIQANPAKYAEVKDKVICAKAEEHILELPDGFTNHIMADGPFGIDYDKTQAAEGVHAAYEDSPESYRERTTLMAPHMYRIIKSDGFLIWFLGHDHLDWTKELFRRAGFKVDPIPLIWDRSDGRCYTIRPDRWFGKGYDIALHCIKGEPQMIERSRSKGVHGSGNVFRYKPVATKDKEHIVERPLELYVDMMQCYSLQGEKIVDFFGGSGAIPAAAASINREYYVTEMDVNHIATIVNKIYVNTPQNQKIVTVEANATVKS